jgi:hypothetical protein
MQFGGCAGKGYLKRICNHQLYKIFNEPDVTKYIQINLLSRAGHIIHIEDGRRVKKSFHTRPERTRKIGKPTLRLKYGVIQRIMAL